MRVIGAVGIVVGSLMLWAPGASAEEVSAPDGTVKASPSNPTVKPRTPRRSHRSVAGPASPAAPVAAAAAAPTGRPGGAPNANGANPGPGAAGGASGTAGGVGGSRRVSNIQGASASPTTPTSLPPGTLDLGNGLTFLANFTNEAAGNPFGGIRQGARSAGQLFLGADADLSKIIGLPGGFLHAIGTERFGNSLTNDLIGNSVSVQEIYGGGQTYRLTYLSYEQKLFDNRIDIEVGRIPGQTAFLASPFYCNFQNNSICGSPTAAFADTNFTYFPAPTWAGVLKTQITEKYFFNVGAYEVAPNSTLRTDHGVDFFEPATGFNVPFEVGYATTFANDTMPRHYGVGAIIDRSSYSDAVLDQGGGQELFTGLSPERRFGRTAAYQRFDQMVYRPDPTQPRGLSLFGLALEGTGGRQIEDYELTAGAVYLGPFDSRPLDSINAAVSTIRYSDIGLANVRAARVAQGLSTDNVARNETFFELNYGYQVSPAVRLTPNLQYILDPDQLREPFRPKPIPDTLVIGAKLSVDLFTLAGLAKGPGDI
ncbi:MAG: carbohydrate porin [Janthinobacterium lividum]